MSFCRWGHTVNTIESKNVCIFGINSLHLSSQSNVMVGILIINIVLIALSVIILVGKGDSLIAGYNTASEQEKQKVNVKRLRYVVAGILILTALFISLPSLCGQEDSSMAHTVSTIAIVVTVIVGVILANTWCKRK